MRKFICLCFMIGWCAMQAQAADVVSNAMSGATHSGLALAVAAAADGDVLVMIGDEVLPATLVISNRVLSIINDGAVRTVRAGTNCNYDMISVIGSNAVLTIGRANGSGNDADPGLVFDGGRNAGVSNLYNLFFLNKAMLKMYPGVAVRHLASVDVGAVHNSLGVFQMHGGRIERNAAPYGAGIYNNMGVVEIMDGSITGNTASVGGGIYNQAVEFYMGYIVGYIGKLEMRGGLVADNAAVQAAGGIYNMGACNLSGGRVERNSAGAGGGVVHYNGTQFGMILSGDVVISGNIAPAGSGVYYNNDAFTWLSFSEGARVEPPNDVLLTTDTIPIVLAGPLAGRGINAQITPPYYATNLPVLGTVGISNLWIVSNYYGKFTVTPAGAGGTNWYVNENGWLSLEDPAEKEPELGAVTLESSALAMAVQPAYVAWNGNVEFATGVVGNGWAFQPLPTNAYHVANGRVLFTPDAPRGVFRVRQP